MRLELLSIAGAVATSSLFPQRCPPRAALLTPLPPLAVPSFGVSRPRRT